MGSSTTLEETKTEPKTKKKHFDFIAEFLFSGNGQLILIIEGRWEGEKINLSKSSLMLFLYQNEDKIPSNELDFAYKIIRYLKKVRVDQEISQAITDDTGMAHFFNLCVEHKMRIKWKYKGHIQPLKYNCPLPVKFNLKQHKQMLIVTMSDRQKWIKNKLGWLYFQTDTEQFCFCNGTILKNPSAHLLELFDFFLDQEKMTHTGENAHQFIQKTYNPNKRHVNWNLKANLNSFIPKEIRAIPHLNITMANDTLSSMITYQYGKTVLEPNAEGSTVKDIKTGKTHKRNFKMEEKFQQELMDLFSEFELPFLLANPGEIGKFLSKVVPRLKDRGWVIHSDVEDIQVLDEALDLTFKVSGDEAKNWFYFEPNADVLGEKCSLQEIARMMIENEGYIKTKKGYVRLTDSSQSEISLLSSQGAFRADKKFTKTEILPLLFSTESDGESEDARSLIDKLKNPHKASPCVPSKEFKAELRDYQQYGIDWIKFLADSGFGGILADDMGLGKTVQTLAFASQVDDELPMLIIGPTNVIYNWDQEIKKFLPKSKAILYTTPKRYDYIEDFDKAKFIITSYGVLKKDIDILAKCRFSAVIADEGQYIKNPNTQVSKAIKRLNSKFRLILSGTPIENHLQDLWNLFDFAMPDYLGTHRSFENDIKTSNKSLVKTKIKPFILRREKGEVLDSLPEKTEITLKCTMSPAQRRIYETVLDAAKKGIRDSVGKHQRLNVLTALLKLRQTCIHPGIVKEFRGQEIESTKFDIIREKIEELMDENHKVVLFSQFTEMLDIIQSWLKEHNFYNERIDGSVTGKSRIDAINRFQDTDKAGVFLLSLKAGGVGINLTSAEYVLHVDPWWNPAIEAQATDRVHRMGQKNKVIVYKLITEGTIEEKIQELQNEKKQLLFEMIDIDSTEEKKLNFDEIKSLLV